MLTSDILLFNFSFEGFPIHTYIHTYDQRQQWASHFPEIFLKRLEHFWSLRYRLPKLFTSL